MTAVFILPSADDDLGDIYDWIAKDDPQAAETHVRRLVSAAQRLRDYPKRGTARPKIGEGARSLTEGRYLILYRLEQGRVEIVRFVHGARDFGELWAV